MIIRGLESLLRNKSQACSRLFVCVLLVATLSSCTGSPFQFKNLAKSDVDLAIDNHIAAYKSLCRELTLKLYKRNPRELAKAPGQTVESRLETLFSGQTTNPAGLHDKQGTDAIELTFDPAYSGDRVFALMYGLIGMLKSTYHFHDEFFSPQKAWTSKTYTTAHEISKSSHGASFIGRWQTDNRFC